jgi:sec-independent protein translocase protein TatB
VFDIGFSEMVVIGVVALVVLGPEKLPRVARTIGALLGRAQRYVNDVKSDINRELDMADLKKMKDEVQSAATNLESTVRDGFNQAQAQVDEMGKTLQDAGNAPADPQALANMSPEALAKTDAAILDSLPPLAEPPVVSAAEIAAVTGADVAAVSGSSAPSVAAPAASPAASSAAAPAVPMMPASAVPLPAVAPPVASPAAPAAAASSGTPAAAAIPVKA